MAIVVLKDNDRRFCSTHFGKTDNKCGARENFLRRVLKVAFYKKLRFIIKKESEKNKIR